jgi:hypothetical protein
VPEGVVPEVVVEGVTVLRVSLTPGVFFTGLLEGLAVGAAAGAASLWCFRFASTSFFLASFCSAVGAVAGAGAAVSATEGEVVVVVEPDVVGEVVVGFANAENATTLDSKPITKAFIINSLKK